MASDAVDGLAGHQGQSEASCVRCARVTQHLCLEGVVDGTRHLLCGLGEQVVQQAQEDAFVIRCQLAEVEVSERPQQHL